VAVRRIERRINATRQPQGPVVVDRESALGSSVVYYQHGDSRDVFGRPVTASTVNPKVSTSRGLLWSLANSAPDIIESSINVSPPFTVAIDLVYPGTFGSSRVLISNGGPTTNGKGWMLALQASTTKFRLSFGGVADYSTSTGDLVAGNLYRITCVVTGNGGTARYFINGVFDSSRSVGTMGTPQSRGITLGAAHNGSVWTLQVQSNTPIGNATVFNRALTDAEVLEEYTNPWRIFRAPRRVIYSKIGNLWTIDCDISSDNDVTNTDFRKGLLVNGDVSTEVSLYCNLVKSFLISCDAIVGSGELDNNIIRTVDIVGGLSGSSSLEQPPVNLAMLIALGNIVGVGDIASDIVLDNETYIYISDLVIETAAVLYATINISKYSYSDRGRRYFNGRLGGGGWRTRKY
jgi:hypothetical protein